MGAEKISITVAEELVTWARAEAKRQRTKLSGFMAAALKRERQHQARERYLKKALAGRSPAELERGAAEAYRDIYGSK